MDDLEGKTDKIVEDALEELIGGLNALYPKPAAGVSPANDRAPKTPPARKTLEKRSQ